MNITRRLALILLLTLLCIGCDQGSKLLAGQYLSQQGMQSYFYDTLRLGYVENHGAFLSLGGSLPEEQRFWLFSVMVTLLLLGLLVYMLVGREMDTFSLAGWSLVLAGGGSNLYDRMMNNGAVVDFMNVGLGGLRTGVFNVADMAILLGVIIVLWAGYTMHKRQV